MRNYIVRVYRRYPPEAGLLSGIVEDVESGLTETFHNLDDLQALLASHVEKGSFDPPGKTTPGQT